VAVTDAMPAGFVDGVRCFNRGDFFEAHEAFEELLDTVDGEGDVRWDLLVALVQVSVGYHKSASGHAGAARMLRLGLEKLSAFPDVTAGVAVAALRTRIREDLAIFDAGTDPATRVAGSPPRIELRASGA
jgi:predicted metal-dependent hydrolase